MKMSLIRNLSLAWSFQKVPHRNVSTTTCTYLDRKWREKKGLPINPNVSGPLTDLPDYTFMDGRTVPLGSRKVMRLQKQREIAEKMVTIIEELNFAQKRFAEKKEMEKEQRNNIIANKLKPKGEFLLKKET